MAPTVELDELGAALGLGRRALVAVVGGRSKVAVATAIGAALDDVTVHTTPREAASLFAGARSVVFQADDDERTPYSVPGPLEPTIPGCTTHVIACIGAGAIGRCIGDRCGHPLRIAALARCGPYERLTPTRAARALLSDRGSRKSCPPTASFVVAITDVEPENLDAAKALAAVLGNDTRAVIVASQATDRAPFT